MVDLSSKVWRSLEGNGSKGWQGKSSNEQAKDIISVEISNDLIVHIFLRLPPKSIIRFRSLSKDWHSRLVSPNFIRNHRLQCSKNPQKVLIKHATSFDNEYRGPTYTLHPGDQFPLDPPGFGNFRIPGVQFPYQCPGIFGLSPVIVGSCNGILCLHDGNEISLWNFSIRRRLVVPYHPPLKSSADKVGFGFGFDPITDDYKIVAISYHTSFVYSLKNESWSVIPSSSRSFIPRSKACFIKGILHWVVEGCLTTEPTNENRSCFILTFDLSSHVFGRILWPDPWGIEHLTTINGCLAVVSRESEGDSGCWVIKEFGKTESLRFKLPTEGQTEVITVFQPIKNGDVVAYNVGSKVYNQQTRDKLIKVKSSCFVIEMEPYVESLELADKEIATTCGKTIFSRRNEVSLRYSCYGIMSALCFEFDF